MTASERLAEIVIDRCLAIGVSEFVVCAGSRNSPLLLEILSRTESGEVRHWSFFEERSAAFFALGRCRKLGAPVAVVTTSGTAAAELLPAVIEAHYQRAPLLCITADRPKSFRGTGAPQAIEQAGLFGEYARASWDIEAEDLSIANWDRHGPAHLNVCLNEPLLSEAPRSRLRKNVDVGALSRAATERPRPRLKEVISPTRLLVMLGSLTPKQRPEALEFLKNLTCAVILADATSGLLNHADLRNRTLFGGEAIFKTWRPHSVLRIGGVPSFRFWRDLEDLPEIPVVSVLCGGFSGLARESSVVDSFDEIDFYSLSTEIGSPVLELDQKRAHQLIVKMNKSDWSAEPCVIHALACAIPDNSLVFLGNSLPIREWNLTAGRESYRFEIFGNRGANGIDGNLSTFLGLASGPDVDEAWGIFGDLTTMYDLSAPSVLQQLPESTRLRIVVINNGGGKIFSRLSALAGLPDSQKAVIENHHEIRFGAWAEMWGLAYQLVPGGAKIPEELPDRVVIELRPDAEQTEAFWREYQAIDA